nr:glycosyl transferase [Spirochaetota bacterium]
PGNPRFGEGAFTWLTGSADWFFVAATEWMLGIRPEFGGLAIDPRLPPSFRKCSVTRHFRGAVYRIEIRNPKGRAGRVESVIVDGHKLKDNLIPPFKDKKVHNVKVNMA